LPGSSEGHATAADQAVIDAWLRKLAKGTMAIYGSEGHSNLGNHRYGRPRGRRRCDRHGDKASVRLGVDSYRLGVCQVQENGALPIELTAARARATTISTLSRRLVMLAEMGARNGLDTYGRMPGPLHRLVKFVLSAVEDPSEIEKARQSHADPVEGARQPLAWVARLQVALPAAGQHRASGQP